MHSPLFRAFPAAGGPLAGAGLHGRLGSLGTIESKYDVAISTACGALNWIVVETTDGGQVRLRSLFIKSVVIGEVFFTIYVDIGLCVCTTLLLCPHTPLRIYPRQACVEYLRALRLGRAKFIILEKVAWVGDRMRRGFAPPSASTPRLFDLVKPKEVRRSSSI